MPRFEYPSLRQGLVGAWCPSLGASGLSLIDRSGRGNHGTLTNMGGQQNWVASGSGLALNFDGVNDWVSFPFVPLQSGVTISYWFKHSVVPASDGYPNRQMVVNAAGASIDNILNYSVVHGATTINYVHTTSVNAYSGFGATVTHQTTKWRHASATCNYANGAAAIYVDGVLSSTATMGVPPSPATAGNSRIGRHGNGVEWFNGQLDDVRIYNRALTPAEIKLLASRRGIGLTPLPDRAAGLPRKLSVNVGGTWLAADSYINVGGVWRLGQASVNVAGVWK